MPPLYTALFVICMVSPINEWQGDRESGPTCVSATVTTWPTLLGCEGMLWSIRRRIQSDPAQQAAISRHIPFDAQHGWNVKGSCESKEGSFPVIDEVWVPSSSE